MDKFTCCILYGIVQLIKLLYYINTLILLKNKQENGATIKCGN